MKEEDYIEKLIEERKLKVFNKDIEGNPLDEKATKWFHSGIRVGYKLSTQKTSLLQQEVEKLREKVESVKEILNDLEGDYDAGGILFDIDKIISK